MTRRALSELDDWKLVDDGQDLRGQQLIDQSGRAVGTVDEMIVDTDEKHVVAIRLDSGQIYPADSFRIRDDKPILMEGATPMRGDAQLNQDRGGQRVPVREEELRAEKHTVESGEVLVHKEVVEDRQSFTVPTSRDEVTVQRRPVDRPSDRPVGEEETYRIPIREEKVEVTKRPVVREEIEIGKRSVQDDERVSGTVRREQVDIEREGNVSVRADHDHRFMNGRCADCGANQPRG